MHQQTRYHLIAALALWGSVGLTATLPAFAQPPSQGSPNQSIRRPTISPYLNLLNQGGNNTGLNYHNFVRPQQQFRSATGQLQDQVRSLQSGVQNQRNTKTSQAAATTSLSTGRMAPTGHSATFGNLGGYYPDSARR